MLKISPENIPLPPSPPLSIASFPSNDLPLITDSCTLPPTMTDNPTSETGSSIPVLELHNHHQWNGAIMSYFLEHNLDGIVDGSEPCPDSTAPTERSNWILRQKKAAGFISRKIDSRNRDLIINDLNRKDPQAIWMAIKNEYSSKKARNRSRLFTAFLSLNCRDSNLRRVTAEFRQITSQLSDIGVSLDDDLLAHYLLHLLPDAHKTIKTVIVTTAESSDTALTTAGVLSQVDELVKDNNSTPATSSALTATKTSRHAYRPRCTNGIHNPDTAHDESKCFQLHPELNPYKTRTNLATIIGRALTTLIRDGNTSKKPILDSGASQSMVHDRSVFTSYKPTHTEVKVANGNSVYGIGIGTVTGVHKGERVSISNCLHVPALKANLVSMGDLAKKGCSINFEDNGSFKVMQDASVALSGSLSGGVMELDLDLGNSQTSFAGSTTSITNGHLLHSRLGHPGPIPFHKVFPGVELPSSCEPCILSKLHRLPHRGHIPVASCPLHIIHSDLSGIISPPSLGEARYYFKITDSFSSYKFIHILQFKSETFSAFMKTKNFVENQTGLTIREMVNDNGGEYVSGEFKRMTEACGIKMSLTAPYTPQQNPVAEIGNRTTTEKARTLLKQASLPAEFWAEAVSTAVYLENITPLASRNWSTPFELWHKRKPRYDHLKVFGCLAYVHMGKERRSGKFSDVAKKGVLLGYQDGKHNYQIWLIQEKRIVYSHDVVFNESVFPFSSTQSHFDFSIEDDNPVESVTPQAIPPSDSSPLCLEETETSLPYESSSEFSTSDLLDCSSQPVLTPIPKPSFSYVPISAPAPRAISSNIDQDNILSHRRRANAATASLANSADPVSYNQAINRSDSNHWIDSIKKELDSLERMNVWTEMLLPVGERALGTTWAFKRKTNQDNVLIKYKSRLCAQGYSQREGIDYNDTYSPTGRLATLRTLLSIGATEDFDVEHMDAVGAFLNGVPKEVLYIKIPQGYKPKNNNPDVVLKLNKSLYGLKQSPLCWYTQLLEFFSSIQFSPSKADPCFFVSSDPGWKCGAYVHVDDLCIVGQDTPRFKRLISARFEMEDLGPCTFFLGMRVSRDRSSKTITLTQEKYIQNMLIEYGMEDCHTVTTPMVPNSHLIPATDAELSEFKESKEDYRRAVGLLNYLVQCTRPDLAIVSSQLSQFLDRPGSLHWAAFKRVLRYLRFTTSLGLVLGGKEVKLEAYSDSDYAGCPYTRRSTTGYCHFIAGGCVSWRARKQPTVATSSTEAEYRAAYEATQDVIWLRKLLSDFGYPQDKTTVLHCDNQGSIALASNPLFQS